MWLTITNRSQKFKNILSARTRCCSNIWKARHSGQDIGEVRPNVSLFAQRGDLQLSPSCCTMPSTKKKRKVSDLTVDDANALLRTLAEFQDQLDEEDEDIPTGLISGLQQLRKKLEVIPVRCYYWMRLTWCWLTFFPLAHSIFKSWCFDSPPGQNQDRHQQKPEMWI